MSTAVVTPTLRTGLRRAVPFLAAIGVIVLALLVVGMITTAQSDDRPLSPTNASPTGAQALARVLEDHGVSVHSPTRATEAIRLLRSHGEDATLVIIEPGRASDEVLEALLDASDERVLVDTSQVWDELLPGLTAETTDLPATSAPRTLDAGCDDPRAAKASSLSVDALALRADRSWETCFVDDAGHAHWAVQDAAGVRTTVIPSGLPMRNASITKAGNAAAMLALLGAHPHVVWYIADWDDTLRADASPTPAWRDPLLVAVGATVLVLALALGRRFGRLVPEETPSWVPASETVVGRARLMHRGHAHEHAARTLRVRTAGRLAARLGVMEDRSADALRDALASRAIDATMSAALWDPPPRSDKELTDLVARLHALEEAVNDTL